MSTAYYLPDETARLVQELVEGRLVTCQNLALILDKYLPADVLGNSQRKSDWLKSLAPNSRIDTALTRAAYHRWSAMMSALRATQFSATLDWRMVIGLGGGTVLETDLTLHHLYGIPFIPGSALKGLTRAYVTGEVEGYKSKQIEDDNEEIQHIFGSQKQAGTVIFFDALPSQGEASFVLDIMNPHYSNYYSKPTELPTNDQNPIPVTFLTVTETIFTFALAPRNPRYAEDVKKATQWLQKALAKYGVGGKTSAGYGYFTVIPDEQNEVSAAETAQTSTVQIPSAPPVDPELRKAEGYKREIDALRDVAGQIKGHYDRWKQLTSPEAQLIVARAIMEKVRQAKREKVSAEKAWYKELRAFLDAAGE